MHPGPHHNTAGPTWSWTVWDVIVVTSVQVVPGDTVHTGPQLPDWSKSEAELGSTQQGHTDLVSHWSDVSKLEL